MALTVILEDIRSTYNVGAIMRTLDAVGGDTVVCCGITPYPDLGEGDDRSPVVISSNTKAIAKTALGAERSLALSHFESAPAAIGRLAHGTTIVALEQAESSIELFDYKRPAGDLALILGSETEGVSSEALALCDALLEIPQYGTKESLNVSVAAGIALYHLRRART
jgi:23S rRNA (guanosine2251-2'-O)-methyltransferase